MIKIVVPLSYVIGAVIVTAGLASAVCYYKGRCDQQTSNEKD